MIENALQPFLDTKTKDELFRRAVKEAIIMCPVGTPLDVVNDPQLAAREYWTRVDHENLGQAITYPGAPVKMSEAPWRIWRRPPLVGEHNEEIYIGELGFTREQLAILKARGAI